MPRRASITALALCFFLLCALAACSQPSAAQPTATTAPTTAATATPTQQATALPTATNIPSGWSVFAGDHFTIAYPPTWTYTTSPPQTGLQGMGVSFSNGQQSGVITVIESYGYSPTDAQSLCSRGGTPVTFDGLPMSYMVGEGVHRNWTFVNHDQISFDLDAFDAAQPQAVQQADDAVLATFRPANPTPLCS